MSGRTACVLGCLLMATRLAAGDPLAVEVRLENYQKHCAGDCVEVDDEDGRVCGGARVPADGVCVIRNLAPGRYVFKVVIHPYGWNQVAAEEKIEIVEGQTAPVTIRLKDPLDPKLRVPLEGSLEVPKSWGAVEPRMQVARDANVPGSVEFPTVELRGDRWSCGGVFPGTYVLEVMPFTCQVLVEVGRQGTRDVKVVVPEPVDVTVRAVDADSGAAMALDGLSWRAKLPEMPMSVLGSISAVTVTRGSDGGYHFRAPKGTIVLNTKLVPPGYYDGQMECVIGPGPASVTFSVARKCGVVLNIPADVDLTKMGSPPLPEEVGLKVSGDGKELLCALERERRRLLVYLTQPGSYAIGSDILGIPVQRVVVKPGAFVEVGEPAKAGIALPSMRHPVVPWTLGHKQFTVQLTKDGGILLGTGPSAEMVSLNGLQARLKEEASAYAQELRAALKVDHESVGDARCEMLEVVLRADRDACWRDVEWVLLACAEAHIWTIGCAVSVEDHEADEPERTCPFWLPTFRGPRPKRPSSNDAAAWKGTYIGVAPERDGQFSPSERQWLTMSIVRGKTPDSFLYRFNDREAPVAEKLQDALSAAYEAANVPGLCRATVAIQANDDVPLAAVVAAIDAVHAAGIEKIDFVASSFPTTGMLDTKPLPPVRR